MSSKALRAIVLIAVVGSALAAYVWVRRSRVKANEAAAPASSGEAPGARDLGSGMGADGPGPGPDGEPGPDGADDRGVDPGMPDPEGVPGTMGPRADSVCIRRAPPAEKNRFQLSGKATFAGRVETGREGVTTILATDVPLEQWGSAARVLVYEATFVRGDAFQMDFYSPVRRVHLCAIRTSDYQDFTYAHVGGCLTEPVSARAEGAVEVAADIALPMAQLKTSLEMIGFSGLIPRHVWPGTEERRVSGRILLPGKPAARFLVAVADFPILDNPEAEENPGGLYVTPPGGAFDLRFLSPPDAELHVCAIGFPPLGQPIAEQTHLYGSACTKVAVPGGARPSGRVTIADIRLQLEASQAIELTGHEQEHFEFLSRCLSPPAAGP